MEKSARNKENRKFTTSAFIIIFIAAFIVYFLTQEGYPNPYNNFVRLADAFLQGGFILQRI